MQRLIAKNTQNQTKYELRGLSVNGGSVRDVSCVFPEKRLEKEIAIGIVEVQLEPYDGVIVLVTAFHASKEENGWLGFWLELMIVDHQLLGELANRLVSMGRSLKKGKKVVTEEDEKTSNLREMIAAEVGEALHDMLPGYFAQMKDELKNEMRSQVEAVVEAAVAARPGGSGGSGGGQSRVTTYKDFSACQPPQFNGQKDPVTSSRWISEVEGAFLTNSCSEEVKVRYAANLLRKAAKDWWNLINRTRTPEQIATMTWEQFKELFKELFKEQYVPQVEVERLTGEFLAMKQTTETVNEITDLFLERSLFCPEYVASERMKMHCYSEILKPEIREFVVMAECKTFHRMHEMARTREVELERQNKRKKAETTQAQAQPVKKFKPTEPRVVVKKEFPSCPKCGRHVTPQKLE
ncbi:hypothetical protein OSB04_025571 [Centaurea solstitialis]|uniref:Ty3 transposon capsid-like protein domain-containing protein n=1 Tax=Centaurea solstitialis TaxID=347529 RepID=A0AA38SNB9_9ASTR|nr:hypothetical protein OSB04_025571 [Centaurea solstitialis]